MVVKPDLDKLLGMRQNFDDFDADFEPMNPDAVNEIVSSTSAKNKIVHWVDSSLLGHTGKLLGNDYMAPLVSIETVNDEGGISIHNMSASSIKFIQVFED